MSTTELEQYFRAKAYVDAKSLHEPTKSLFLSLASKRQGRVLDLGCGSGKMLERLLQWNLTLLTTLTGVDSDPLVMEPFESTFSTFFGQVQKEAKGNGIEIAAPSGIQISLYIEEAEDFLRKEGQFDVVTACSFFDLVDTPSFLPLVYEKLKTGGLAYFVCNFDGETSFEPVISPELDERVMRLYHDSMRARNLKLGIPEGEYRSGRNLVPVWQSCRGRVLSTGPSDWVIYPRDGKYREEERHFLQAILNLVVWSVAESPEIGAEEISYWCHERTRHLEKGELSFVARNLDFLGTK